MDQKHLSKVQISDIQKRLLTRTRGEAGRIAKQYGITRRHVYRIWASLQNREDAGKGLRGTNG